MELILRGAAVYLALFLLMRAAGNRQFSQMTAFDAVLVILVAEVTGQSLIGEDYSFTGSLIVLTTIIGLDLLMSILKKRSKKLQHVVDGIPVLLMNEGKPIEQVLQRERLGKEDILTAARETHGIERLEQVKYAVLEPDGKISVVPWSQAPALS